MSGIQVDYQAVLPWMVVEFPVDLQEALAVTMVGSLVVLLVVVLWQAEGDEDLMTSEVLWEDQILGKVLAEVHLVAPVMA